MTGIGTILVRRSIAEELAEAVRGLEFEPVHIVNLRKYNGPEYVEMIAPLSLSPLEVGPWIHVREHCPGCGRYQFWIEGAEVDSFSSLLPGRSQGPRQRLPRDLTKGMRVSGSLLGTAEVFRVAGTFIYCTERVYEIMMSKRYTNVDFWDVGDVD